MKVLAFSADPALHTEAIAKANELGEAITVDAASLPDQDTATLAAAVAQIAEAENVDLVLLGASKKGKDVGPRAAGLLDWAYAAEVQSLEHGESGWTTTRMVLSGNSKATYTMGAKAVVTFTAKTFEGLPAGEARPVAASGLEASKVQVTGTSGGADGDFDLSSATYVVGVGRGFKDQADIKLAEDLAAKLPGGAVGCSRPIAADLKWLGEEHWIGLSGHEIKPKIYFASGVSGQIQHVAGIRGSKLIVAINTNKDAPIFQVADYGIVGDLYKLLPEIAGQL
ncbi:MAG: electron transfer flavoprotein subunit alpha/FixB family protein [Thermoplasmatota archaeon]